MVTSSVDITSKHSVSVLNRRYRKQLLAAITIQFLTFAHGIVTGWLSPTLLQLQSDDSPTDFIVTTEQVSWIGSMFGLGSMLANLIFGLLLNRAGRKWCMYLIALPYIAAWILIYFSKNYVYLYAARFLNGMTGGGNYIVVPIFISEISDPCVRGALSSMAMLFLSFGMIAGFLLSSYIDYYLNPCIIIIFPIVYLIGVTQCPETPQHLLRKQKIDEAYKSFRFYKNLPKQRNTKTMADKQLEVEVDCEFVELKQNVLSTNGETQKVVFKDFVSRESLKAFLTVFILLFITQYSGSFAFISYMSNIFAVTGTDINPNTCTILMGIIQTVGIFLTVALSDRVGRKLLLLVSTSGMAVGYICFSLYMHFTSAEVKLQYNWFPIVIMAFIILLTSMGLVGLLFTFVVENLPTKIRSVGTAISMFLLSFLVFTVLKIFPPLLENYGLAAVLLGCGSVCAFGWLYILLCLKETKGIYLDK